MEEYKCNDFNKSGTVRLPSKWRKRFGLLAGALVDIQFDRQTIWIRKHSAPSTDNTRVISEEGTVTIPAELRKLMQININDEFCLYIDETQQCFILKLDNKVG